MAKGRISRHEFTHVWDLLQAAIDEDILDEDQLRELIAILEPAAELARQRERHGGPSPAEAELN
jgi:truncated hemoglobin YjbI